MAFISKFESQSINSKYRPDIDGLRAIAVLFVVAFHAFPEKVKGGFIGVDIFFVISGFLISTIIAEQLEKGNFSFIDFYVRRIKRIFPALSIVLFSCLLFAWFCLLPDELQQLGKHVAAGAGFVSNWVLWSEAGYFDNSAETKPLLHLWSLGIEEQFYIIWPCVLVAAWKRRWNLFYTIGCILSISFLLNIGLVFHNQVAAFYYPMTRGWELLSGAMLARYALCKPASMLHFLHSTKSGTEALTLASNAEVRNWLPDALSLLGVLCLMLGFVLINKDLNFPGFWAALPVLGTVLLILSGPGAWLNQRVLSHKLFVWVGLISFPLYLWHWPILSFGRIVYFDDPPLSFKILAIMVSILLAWLTMNFIEKPLRFGGGHSLAKAGLLSGCVLSIGMAGAVIFNSDFSGTHTFDQLSVKRRGEHAIGASLAWYQGKENWLFLGNAYDNNVAKLKLSVMPTKARLAEVKESFSKISQAGAKHGIKTVLIMGPDKSSIYSEYLPEGLTPSTTKYSGFFLDTLRELPTLEIYDPTQDLLAAKNSEEILYWKTDTHWNYKGAYIAYVGFSKLLKLPYPSVDFSPAAPYSGDLIGVSQLKYFPSQSKDSWDPVWRVRPEWLEKEIPNEQKTAFGASTLVTNVHPLSEKYVWVLGDSFTVPMKQYFNATFSQVRYLGHWGKKLSALTEELDRVEKKPDLIVIVRVERSF